MNRKMYAVISSTYDDKYFFFIPIVAWLWERLGFRTILTVPHPEYESERNKLRLISLYVPPTLIFIFFNTDKEYQATYAQVSRLYICCYSGINADDLVITSDVDMAVFGYNFHMANNGGIWIFGADLTPSTQYPMCYIAMKGSDWREVMEINGRTMQECLDDLLGPLKCENMRGNYWAKDQELVYNQIIKSGKKITLFHRARPGTQFATQRVDRDDLHYKDRWDNIMDAHLWRPGYEDANFEKIIELIQREYPMEDIQWMIDYRNEYVELIN